MLFFTVWTYCWDLNVQNTKKMDSTINVGEQSPSWNILVTGE